MDAKRWIGAALLGLAALAARAEVGPPGQIRVTVDAPDAFVTCDGVGQDVPPVTITNLEAGLHLVTVRKSGYEEDRETVNLSPGQKALVEVKLAQITGLVLIHSSPVEAEIEIDGAHRGTTPLLLTDLPVGAKYRVKATASGFLPREMDLAVPDRTPRQLDVVLNPDAGALSVESTPPGASVSVNGAARGVTPCEIDRVPAGENKIEIALDGYIAERQNVRLQAGESQKIAVVLKRMPARLTVVSVPEGAKVYVDDQFADKAPVTLDALEAGTHAVRLELRGYEATIRNVEVKQGEAKTEEFKLVANSGVLEVVTEPAGVKVAVDGEDSGVTKPGVNDAVSEPLRVELLAQGEHRIHLTRKGYVDIDRAFLVEANKTATLREKLKRRFVPDTIVHTGPGPDDFQQGIVANRLPNGDVVLETRPGIFVTIKAADIKGEEQIPPPKE